MAQDQDSFSVQLTETRKFPPSEKFVKNAKWSPEKIAALRELGHKNPDQYWSDAARELEWTKPFTKIHEWNPPFSKWFSDGELNVSVNCVDAPARKNPKKRAILWEGEPLDGKPEIVDWSYADLLEEVGALAGTLRALGIKKGDRVAIYLPLVPEAAVAMLACARVGATHTVIFGGFSSDSLKDRVNDAGCKAVLTADFGYRKGGKVALREQVEKAVAHTTSVEFVLTLARDTVGKSNSVQSRSEPRGKIGHASEYGWYEKVNAHRTNQELRKPESVPAEHPLFILYTSGTTGKPKGLVHSSAGYLTGVRRSTDLVFDIQDNDLYWCTADVGWVTGHSYLVYGPLSLGASIFMYEGAPTTPKPDRFWDMIERHRITILYTAPTAIRSFMRLGEELPKSHDLSSLRLLGSVGEPINPEAWMWYRNVIGGGHCPIVDTYWQTETGAIVLSPLPSETVLKPGSATKPMPGMHFEILSKKGEILPKDSGGYLAIMKPWPSQARTVFGDDARYSDAYFKEFGAKIYFTGDGARVDSDGDFWALGRVDDVLNVSGHRLGTMEIESAIVANPLVAEAAVVGRPDELKGQGIVAFVTLKADVTKRLAGNADGLKKAKEEIRAEVTRQIGALARPDDIRFTDALPKTRSGKIMRRLLRELATSGEIKGDTSTLEDLQSIAALRSSDEE